MDYLAYSKSENNYKAEYNYFKSFVSESKKYELLILIENIKKEFRDEKWLMLYIFYFIYFDTQIELDSKMFIM